MAVREDEKNIHTGHRRRMMERFGREGFDGWQAHETSEALLYSVLPRVNTNPHGHRLINAFGSLRGMLRAARDEMIGIRGIGPASADYLSAIHSDVSEMILGQYRGTADLNAYQLAFLADWFMRDDDDRAGMLVLDPDGRFADFMCVSIAGNGGAADPETAFGDVIGRYENHTFSLFVKPENRLSDEDAALIRAYTFRHSFILDEIYVMNGREPVPTLHPHSPPPKINE